MKESKTTTVVSPIYLSTFFFSFLPLFTFLLTFRPSTYQAGSFDAGCYLKGWAYASGGDAGEMRIEKCIIFYFFE